MKKYRNIVIEGKCNLNCKYCSSHNYNTDVNAIINSLKQIFDKFVGEKVVFRVECFGEITLYPQIIDYLEFVSKIYSDFDFEILTNGTLISRYYNEKSLLKWVVSLDGHTETMNSKRGLKQEIINEILKYIVKINAEIQCVYWGQKISDINNFIMYLKQKNYQGFLHFFSEIDENQSLKAYLDYDLLVKANFIATKEYFDKWKYIYDGNKRNFVCDHLINGYVYQINEHGEISGIKCDCINSKGFKTKFGEPELNVFDCQNCIQNNEYNNKRRIMI